MLSGGPIMQCFYSALLHSDKKEFIECLLSIQQVTCKDTVLGIGDKNVVLSNILGFSWG